MVKYELLDHTADIGIIISAKDLRTLFVNAALAMFEVIVERKDSKKALKTQPVKLNLQADNLKELFVRWLGELLSISDSKGLIFTKITIEEFTETQIKAVALGAKTSEFRGLREVKAVTHHELKIEKEKDRYSAEVIFDV